MFDYTDKVIVVTGAAGNLGRAVVDAFLAAGGTVCGLDHRQGRLAEMFPEHGGALHIYENADLTDRKALIALGGQIQAEVGRVDVLVNTVGGFTMGERVDQISIETWDRMMNINVRSFLNAAAAFVPGMLAAGGGKVVSVGAGAALEGGAKMGAYAAAKAAVLRLTESMAAELKASNIQANCILPGTIDTPENRQAMPNADFGKWVTPEQVADVILFLSSPDADAISGAAVPIDNRTLVNLEVLSPVDGEKSTRGEIAFNQVQRVFDGNLWAAGAIEGDILTRVGHKVHMLFTRQWEHDAQSECVDGDAGRQLEGEHMGHLDQ